MTREDVLKEFGIDQWDVMADEIVRLRAILAKLREPSWAVVEAAAEALYLRGDLAQWCTWEQEIARYKETYYEDAVQLIRAAVAAAEKEAS